MNEFAFLFPLRIHIIWLALLFVGLLALLEMRRSDALARFVSQRMQVQLVRQMSSGRRIVRLVLIGLVCTFTVLALMRPQTTRSETKTGKRAKADVMVVLDVSKSMLAADTAPSRLERAKADIRDMLPSLRGSRMGLIAFAGRASVMCPLTPDQGFFQLVLDSVEVGVVRKGGTRIGDALRKALEGFGEGATGPRAILLITDGEDHDSYPLDAADLAAQEGVPVVAIGFGDEDGSEIEIVDPDTGVRKKHVDREGNVIRTKLDGAMLRSIAERTKGVYVPAGTAVLDLDSILKEHITPLLDDPDITVTKDIRHELYPWALLGALLALFGAVLVSTRLMGQGSRLETVANGNGGEA